MTLLTRFDTPASLRDLPDDSDFYDRWHNVISDQIVASTPGGGGVGEFYNASLVDVDVVGERALAWMAFPRLTFMGNRGDRDAAFRSGEDREFQNEYCEWRVSRNAANKITKVVFVTESPEYWEILWAADRARVVELYRDLLDEPAVSEADLDDGSGGYNRRNRWNDVNSDGIIHLIQSINTLADALGIVQFVTDSSTTSDNYEETFLAATSVDARVELDIDALVRKGLSVTLRDPIGLYIAAWDDTGWTKPNGKPIGNYWHIVRGRPGQVLRLEYEVPASEGFVVGDIQIGGRPIEWGGQLAEHVTVTIVGTAGTRVHAAPLGTAVPGNQKRERNEEAFSQSVQTRHAETQIPRRRVRRGESL